MTEKEAAQFMTKIACGFSLYSKLEINPGHCETAVLTDNDITFRHKMNQFHKSKAPTIRFAAVVQVNLH